MFEADIVLSFAGVAHVAVAAIGGCHVLLNKQNERAAFGWLGLIVLSPLFGAALYWLFGINRIRRRARAERPNAAARLPPHRLVSEGDALPAVGSSSHTLPGRWQQLLHLGCGIHDENYVDGNAMEPLVDGDTAYPQMLKAIDQAVQQVRLSSYIFALDEVGGQFVDALVRAHQRGVEVRVLIDGVGVTYGWSLRRADRALRRQGVRTERFLSAFSRAGTRFVNLRNHRKILLVDGQLAFVGGLNIRENNLTGVTGKHRTRDVHFCVRGPVVAQIDAAFRDDWRFACKERLTPATVQPSVGGILARVLLDGPDEDYNKLQMTMLGVINAARSSIRIVTPYFLPERSLINALELAALRGVRVEIILPGKCNLPFVGWAMQANYSRLLPFGIHLFESPEPFDHSKLFLVDGVWALIGSSNWDARSLELNFEINLECYEQAFNQTVAALIDRKRDESTEITHAPKRSIVKRLRNNFFRLFSPYL